MVSEARSHGGKAKTNFPTPTELHLDVVESSSPPSPRPLDLTLRTPLLSIGGNYFTAASGFRPLPASRPVIFFNAFARADNAAALQHARETCRVRNALVHCRNNWKT